MLIELKNYLAKVKTASLQDLSQRFNSEAQLIRQMIGLLLNKGLVLTKITWAGAPFITGDTDILDPQTMEVYLFANLDKTHTETTLQAPTIEIDWGISPNLMFSLTVPYAISKPKHETINSGLGDITAGISYRFNHEAKHIPQIALAPTLTLPSGDENHNLGNGKMSLQLPIWLQKDWDRWTSSFGGGYSVNLASDKRNYLFAGGALQRSITDKLSLGTEIFSQGADSEDGRDFTLLNIGGSYHLNKTCELLFSVGHSILGERHLVSYLGLHWQL